MKKQPTLLNTQSPNGEWFFTLISTNGKKALTGGELFKRKRITEKQRERLIQLLINAVIVDKPLKKKLNDTTKSTKRIR